MIPEYKISGEKVDIPLVVDVIDTLFGPTFQKAGVTHVVADNDKKLQSRAAVEAWDRWGIKLYSGVGTAINKDTQKGFPLNSPVFQPLDLTVYTPQLGKNLEGGLYDRWKSRPPSKKKNGGFVNDVYKSWTDMPIEHIQNAIDEQYYIVKAVIENEGKRTEFDR